MWRNLSDRTPSYLDRGADFTPVGLKAFFEVVFNLGFVAGAARGRALGRQEVRIENDLSRMRRENYEGFLKTVYATTEVPDDGEVQSEAEAAPERAA